MTRSGHFPATDWERPLAEAGRAWRQRRPPPREKARPAWQGCWRRGDAPCARSGKAGRRFPCWSGPGQSAPEPRFPARSSHEEDWPASLRESCGTHAQAIVRYRRRVLLQAHPRSGRPLVFPRLPQRRVPTLRGCDRARRAPGRLEGAPLRANSPTAPSKCAFAASGSDMVATRPSARRSAACIAPVDTFKTTARNCCRAASASCLSPSST